MIDEVIERCCCECGEYFEGYSSDDYCLACYEEIDILLNSNEEVE